MDRVTHDALSLKIKASDNLSLFAAYANKRNRLFGEDQDQKSKDIYLNAAYDTSFGKVTAYAYLLEDDYDKVTLSIAFATDDRETYGLRLNGSFSLGSRRLLHC